MSELLTPAKLSIGAKLGEYSISAFDIIQEIRTRVHRSPVFLGVSTVTLQLALFVGSEVNTVALLSHD